MNKFLLTGIAAVFATTSLAYADDDQARVRVIHATPETPAVTVKAGDVTLFQDVAFNTVTPYKTFPAQDDVKLTLNLADGRQVTTTDEMDLDDDDDYHTILIAPDQNNPNPKVVILETDRDDDMDDNEGELHVFNVSPNRRSINVQLDDNTVERGINYSDAESIDDIKAGNYTLKLIDSAGTNEVIATQQVNIAANSSLSVILHGDNQVKIINDDSPNADLASQANTALATTERRTTGTGMARNANERPTGSVTPHSTNATTGSASSPGIPGTSATPQ